MASRKDQKEQLRREREEREAAAKAAERRRRMIGYGAGLVLVIAAVVVGALLLSGGGDGGGGGNRSADSDVLPEGGEVPKQRVDDIEVAVRDAGCKVSSKPATASEHTEDPAERIAYTTNPPTSGKHFAAPAEDGAYETAPDVKELVHSLEHGRVIIWFKKSLSEDARASLNALFEEEDYHLILVPNETNMPFEVAASAWNGEPRPNGTGRVLGCAKYGPATIDALRTFRDEHRDNGLENVP